MVQTDNINLDFEEFSKATYEDWRQAIDKMLKGSSFEKKLITKTYENIELQPIYCQENTENLPHINSMPGVTPYLRGSKLLGHIQDSWDIAQEILYTDPKQFNHALHVDMQRGQNAINLIFDHATMLGIDANQMHQDYSQNGLSISSLDHLVTALDGINIESVPIFMHTTTSALAITAFLFALLKKQGKLSKIRGTIGMDPLGQLVSYGYLPGELTDYYAIIAQLINWTRQNTPDLRVLTVHGDPYHNGGASVTQELAFVLATAVEYLRVMQQYNLDIKKLVPSFHFAMSVGSNFFMEIAKFRAARLLWAKIVKECGGSENLQTMCIHARTSHWNKTIYDQHVNLLRSTTEALASVIAGCDSLHVSAFDELSKIPDTFSRRIARNTQIIIREETQVTKTIDPAGGSWYIESLTASVAKEAWDIFRKIEELGGMYKALCTGWPQKQVADTAEKRALHIAKRKDIFVGTNMYPNLKEVMPPMRVHNKPDTNHIQKLLHNLSIKRSTDNKDQHVVLNKITQARLDGVGIIEAAIEAALSGVTLNDITSSYINFDSLVRVNAISAQRGTHAIEQVRIRTEEYYKNTGKRPQVFLATVGELKQHKARTDFVTAFLGVGGFEAIYKNDFTTASEAAEAAIQAHTMVVVICSTDDKYPTLVPQLVQILKVANPEMLVILAGYPVDYITAFKTAGIDDFIHINADCQSLLSKLQHKMGVA